MGELVRQVWVPTVVGIGVPRRDRRAGPYEAYVPGRLADLHLTLDGDVAADVADAERAIGALDAVAAALTNTEGLARLLLRAESVASSRIEGLRVSAQRLLHEAAARAEGSADRDPTASEVLANVDAMAYALEDPAGPVTVERIREVHRRLLATSAHHEQAGVLRAEQNWIGGNDFNPIGAAFVPPPPELVPELLDDLTAFCNDDGLPAVAQAAIAHAQFETIHPFADGNGRTGRALIYMVLRRRGLAKRTTPPISLTLATQARTYVDALTATRVVGAPLAELPALNRWIAIFAAACQRAVADALDFEQRVEALQAAWRERLGPARPHASARRLLSFLPATPILTVDEAAKLLDRRFWAANQAIARLVDAGILTPTTTARRARRFEAREVLDAFAALERQLASPDGDTRVSSPVRAVPPRPRRRG
ncbi:MAG: Fic family protein [Vulcanimicrobiaceae bacterium]